MATVDPYFNDFLASIRPTEAQRRDMASGHRVLRERLNGDSDLGKILVSTFIQGSYRRSTAIKPRGEKRSDVDVVVVTSLLEKEYTPDAARQLFVPFLEKHYAKKFTPQGRSFAIELGYVDLDLVITSAPAMGETNLYKASMLTDAFKPGVAGEDDADIEDPDDDDLLPVLAKSAGFTRLDESSLALWKPHPLRIPDSESKRWEDTHPVGQLRWTTQKNKNSGGCYVNVVKAIKWWRRTKVLNVERPKGYPVEALVGVACPDDSRTLAEAVVRTFEAFVRLYAAEASAGITPVVPDNGGVSPNVLARVEGKDFAAFYAAVVKAAQLARRAFDEPDTSASVSLWRELFGDDFPPPPSSGKKGGFTPSTGPSVVGGGRYA